MKLPFHLCLVLSLLLTPALACGGFQAGVSNGYTIEVIANPGASPWLTQAAQAFNEKPPKLENGRAVQVTLRSMEAGQVVAALSGDAPGPAPALWVPDDPVWTDILAEKGQAAFQGDCASLASSPLVIAVWRPLAEALGWPGRSLGWLDMGSLAADPSAWLYYSGGQFSSRLRLSHTNPGLAHSGSSTLLAVVQAALSKTEPVSAEEVQQPMVQASVGAFESAVSSFGADTELLGQAMRQRGVNYLGAAVLYESTVLRYAEGDPQLIPVYPFEGTFVATHPACLNRAVDGDAQQAARLFRDYLLGEKAQELAVANGLRPARSETPLRAPLDAAHGVDLAQPAVVFAPPSAANIYAVQSLWQSARKHVNLVMVIDTSGSMQGSKMNSVRQSALQFVQQMGSEDYLSLISYASAQPMLELEYLQVGPAREQISRKIAALQAKGGTPLYDSIGAAAEVVAGHLSSQNSNVIVLLSDGLDTASNRYGFDQALFDTAAANDTTVFTIAYGGDADEKLLTKLAQNANGNFYLGSEANIAAIYQEMSAAFGGSVGIGR